MQVVEATWSTVPRSCCWSWSIRDTGKNTCSSNKGMFDCYGFTGFTNFHLRLATAWLQACCNIILVNIHAIWRQLLPNSSLEKKKNKWNYLFVNTLVLEMHEPKPNSHICGSHVYTPTWNTRDFSACLSCMYLQ